MKRHLCPLELKLALQLFGLVIFFWGCSSSSSVRSTSVEGALSYGEMNNQLRERSANIEMIDGRDIFADNVTLSGDSVSWLDASTSETSKVSTRQIRRIVIKNHFIGALEGMGIGLLVGGSVGFILGSSGPEGGAWGRSGQIAMGLIVVGGTGVIVGLIPGLIIGHSYEYEFPRAEQSDSTQNSK